MKKPEPHSAEDFDRLDGHAISDEELIHLVGESPCARAPAPERETYDEFLARLAHESESDQVD